VDNYQPNGHAHHICSKQTQQKVVLASHVAGSAAVAANNALADAEKMERLQQVDRWQ
jgi:hypothetical protein